MLHLLTKQKAWYRQKHSASSGTSFCPTAQYSARFPLLQGGPPTQDLVYVSSLHRYGGRTLQLYATITDSLLSASEPFPNGSTMMESLWTLNHLTGFFKESYRGVLFQMNSDNWWDSASARDLDAGMSIRLKHPRPDEHWPYSDKGKPNLVFLLTNTKFGCIPNSWPAEQANELKLFITFFLGSREGFPPT
jgi:hypothetical protein